MMINKQKITKALSKIEASNDLDKRILNSTVYKTEKKIIFNKKNIVFTGFLVFFLTITTVFAKEIIFNYILNKKWVDNQYEQTITITEPITINPIKNYSCDKVTTLSDLESDLGLKFVFDTSKYNGVVDHCEIKVNDSGDIEEVQLSVSEFYDFSKDNEKIDLEYRDDFSQEEYMAWMSKRKIVDIYISFMTSKASEETKEKFKNLGKVTSSEEVDNKEFFAKNINTEGFYFVFPSEKIPLRKGAMFVNNNILYQLSANRPVEIEELLDIINHF